jgi:hypothetical protein
MIWLLHNTLPPPLPSVSSPWEHRKAEKERQLADWRDGEGREEGVAKTYGEIRESLVLYKLFNALCVMGSVSL